MALQQAQMLLSMNSLESLSASVQQNNTESFAVALCHLAELHAEQVGQLSCCVRCCYDRISEETNLKGNPYIIAVQVTTAEVCSLWSQRGLQGCALMLIQRCGMGGPTGASRALGLCHPLPLVRQKTSGVCPCVCLMRVLKNSPLWR